MIRQICAGCCHSRRAGKTRTAAYTYPAARGSRALKCHNAGGHVVDCRFNPKLFFTTTCPRSQLNLGLLGGTETLGYADRG